MPKVTPVVFAVLLAEFVPAAAFAFASQPIARILSRWPGVVRILAPAVFVIPYAVLALANHIFSWKWFAFYTALPVVMAWLMTAAAISDPEQHGNWRDALILVSLGLAVDLRWLDSAWPPLLRGFGNLLLVDVGLYAFLGIRQLSGTGFDFHLHWDDWKIGLCELAFFAPFVLSLGLALGFIHPHHATSSVLNAALKWAGIFIFVASLEELFFRAWVQNYLERRLGRTPALLTTCILFGLAHFNKRNPPGVSFNWRYVLLATIAGIFYGRAWRANRRVPASAITHTFVDWIWTLWF